MKALTLISFASILCGCNKEEPQDARPRVHTIELSNPFEEVQVTVAGREDLMVNVFERDGRLVAAIIDRRRIKDKSIKEVQRWEMLAKSNKEVAVTTQKALFHLKYVDSQADQRDESKSHHSGSILYSDTNGDGIPDYMWSWDRQFKISSIGYEEFQTLATSLDIHELPSVIPNEFFPVSPRNKEAQQGGTGQPATRSQSKSEGGDKPQPGAEGRSR